LLLLATEWGGDRYDWGSGTIIGLYVAGGVLVIVFVFLEVKVAVEPIVPFKTFNKRNVGLPIIIAFACGFSFINSLVYIPVFLQIVWGETATQSGVKTLPLVGGMIFSSILAGGIVAKNGIFNPYLIIGGILTPLGLGLLSLLKVDSSYGMLAGIMVCIGIGVGFCFAVMIVCAQDASDPKDVASITSSIGFFMNLGGVVGAAVFQSVLNSQMLAQQGDIMSGAKSYVVAFQDAMDFTFLVTIAGPLLIFPASLGLKWVKLSQTNSGAAAV